MSLDLRVLDGGVYIKAEERLMGARTVHRYQLAERSSEAVAEAAKAVTALLSANPSLCPVFDSQPEILRQAVEQRSYLTINGRAVCLSAEPKAPEGASYIDAFFSEEIVREPVVCQENHYLEYSFVVHWAKRNGDNCPGGDHRIGEIRVQPWAREGVNQYRQSQARERARDAQAEERFRHLEEDAAVRELRMHHLETSIHSRVSRKVEIGGAFVKVVLKTTGPLTKVAFKEMSVGTTKCLLKAFPIIGFFVGLGLGFYRATQGQWVLAAGEVVSGIAGGFFPGVGTGVSVLLDVAMAGYDLYKTDEVIVCNPDLEKLHNTLGLRLAPDAPPTREEITRAHRQLSSLVHPDKMIEFGDYTEAQCSDLQQLINNARDLLIQHYQYA